MASYNELNALIDAYINRNGVQAITGQILNGVLKAMVEQLGRGYTIMGAATPTTDPGTPDGPECYFASTPGTYTDFDGLQVVPGELALLCYTPTDGWTKATLYEGFRQVTAQADDNIGVPSVGVSYSNGVLDFRFRNIKGEPGENGQDGLDGDAAGFGTIGADITGGVGTPGVSVESSGPATAKNLQFHFTNLKGETGVTSVVATVDNTTGTPACTVSLVGQQLTLAFSGLKGAQGNTGSSVDYPFTIVNNLTTDDATKALSAAQGVVLDGKISQLQQKVDENIYVGNGTLCDLEATRNLRPSSNNTVITGNNGYSYIAKVKSGKSYHIELTVPTTSGNYLRGGFTQVYPANGVAVSGYWDNGTGEAILNKVAPFDGYLLLECAEDFTNIAVYEDNAGTVGREVYNNEVAQDVLKDTAVLAKNPVNLFDKSKGVVLNKYIVARRYESAGGYAITGPIYVKGGVQYKCPHDVAWLSSSNVYAICTPSGEFYEGKQGTISGDFLLFTPEKDCYVCLNIGRTAWVDSFMLCLASDYPEQYVSYSKAIGDDYHLGAMQIQEVRDIVQPALEITQYFETEKSVNLFNKTNNLIKNGYYGGGAFHEDATYRVTHPIKVSGGISYKAVFRANDLGASNTGIAVVDGANNVLSFVYGVVSGNYITITPSEDCYLSFNIGMYSRLDEMMVCVEADFPESYEPFYENTKLTGVEVENAGSRLTGKSVIFTGDSICYGATDTPQGAGWAQRIGEKNNMTWQNKAVSGGTIMNKDLIGSSFTICDTDFGTGADYIILEGGTNDADRIGSITGDNTPQYYGSWNESDYVTAFGKDTFCDAVQRLIQRVVTSFPTAKVGFIIAPKMGVSNSGFDAAHNNRRAYFQTIIEICRKWGVPVLNLWDECTMNPRLAAHYTEADHGPLYYDGQHPTAEGYELMTPIIEKWMESL